MKSIWKFPIEVQDEQIVSMPIGALILCVQTQKDVPCLWALVDPNASSEWRHINIRGTGQPLETDPGKYIGTFQLHGGSLVFHCFEEQF